MLQRRAFKRFLRFPINVRSRSTPYSSTNMLPAIYMVAAVGASSFFVDDDQEKSLVQACGIIGVVGTNKNAKEVLLQGLTILQNRGYDSAGMSTVSSGPDPKLVTTKYANSVGKGSLKSDSIARLRREAEVHSGHSIGIAHTRWATHGGKTDANAHPHHDQKNRIAVVHNGTILNAHEIRASLHEKGVLFRSDTDTEVIAQLIGQQLDTGCSLLEATKRALSQLTGTWGVAVISKDSPGEIVVAQYGSPLAIGIGNNQMFVASEVAAFGTNSTSVIELQDGEIAVVKADGSSLDRSRLRATDVTEKVPSTPDPWPHWTLREIEEQPDAIYRALNFGGRMTQFGVTMGGLSRQQSLMMSIDHLVISACGSSLNAANYGARLMRSLRSFDSVQVADATDFQSKYLFCENGGLLAISQSGETKSVLDCVTEALAFSLPCFSIVNSVGSRIAQLTKVGCYQNAGPEMAVTSTKSFSTQVTVMALMACWFAQNREGTSPFKRDALTQALQRLPTSFKMALRTRNQCKKIAEKIKDAEHCFVIGKGYAEPIAAEAATKFKELACMHAESWVGTKPNGLSQFIKNQKSLAVQSGGTTAPIPVIVLIFDNSHAEQLRMCAKQYREAGGHLICLTDDATLASDISDDVIIIPNNGPLTSLVAIAPLQLLAYELSLSRSLNPDAPRNLSRTFKD